MSAESFAPRPAFDDDAQEIDGNGYAAAQNAAGPTNASDPGAPMAPSSNAQPRASYEAGIVGNGDTIGHAFDAACLDAWKTTQTTSTYAKRAAALLDLDGFPAELRAQPCWMLWAFTDNGPGKKPGKVPLTRAGNLASSTNRATWASFDGVVEAFRSGVKPSGAAKARTKTEGRPVFDDVGGIAFVFDGSGIVGVDLDGCRDPVTGEIAPWARDEVAALASWAEVSPSGTGLHVFVRGNLPGGKASKSQKREMYAQGRFFAMTGRHVEGTPLHVVDVDDGTLAALAARIEEDKREEKAKAKTKAPPTSGSPIVDLYARDVGGMGRADFDEAVAEVASAAPSTRNNTLNECAYRIGRMVAAGIVTEGEAFSRLAAAVAPWGSWGKDEACIRRALAGGLTSRNGPWTPSQRRPTVDELERVARMYEAEDRKAFDDEAAALGREGKSTDDGAANKSSDDDSKAADDTGETKAAQEEATSKAGKQSAKTKATWPAPMPVDIPPAVAFPVDALPYALRDVVRDVGERMASGACDMAGVAALVTCAGAIGKGVRLAVREDWQERACLWGALVARPGQAKSPTLKEMTRPLKDAEAANVETWRERFAAWEAQAKAAKAVEAGWQKATKIGAAKATETGESYTPPPMPAEAKAPPKPPTTRLVVDDGTREALVDLMAQQARGLTLIKDELADWLANFSRHNAKGTDRGFYLTLWSGGGIHVDRIGRGAQYVDDGYLSVIGCLQPATAALHLGRSGAGADDGLLERFGLIACPDDRTPWKKPTGKQDRAAHARYAAVVRRLASTTWASVPELAPESDTAIPDAVPVIRLSSEAAALFEAWEAEHMTGRTAWGDDAGCRSKVPSLVARLALVFHLVDFADGAPDVQEVAGDTMRRVLDFVRGYVLPVLPRVFAIVEGDRERADAAKVCEWLKAQKKLPPTVTLRLIQRSVLQGRKVEQVQAVFDVLVEAGWLQPPTDPDKLKDSGARRGRGRPVAGWHVNPRIAAGG